MGAKMLTLRQIRHTDKTNASILSTLPIQFSSQLCTKFLIITVRVDMKFFRSFPY